MGLREHGFEPSVLDEASDNLDLASGDGRVTPDRILQVLAFETLPGDVMTVDGERMDIVLIALAVQTAPTLKNPEPLEYTLNLAMPVGGALALAADLAHQAQR